MENSNESEQNMRRLQFFSDSLVYLSLASYKGFQAFKECATFIKNRLNGFPLEFSEDILYAKLDIVSMDIFPTKEFPDLVPVKVSGDGNCLPRSASMLVFGDQHHHIEMRVRMACELALNKDFYLNDTNHKMYCFDTFPYCSTITTYSSNFIPGMDTGKEAIETVFELDAMTTAKSGSYCGLWHVYALSSLIGCRLYSIYPKLNSTVTIRPELNRIIFPRKQMSKRKLAIFWTNTNGVECESFWSPNHFAPCFQKNFILKQKQNVEVREFNLQYETFLQTPHRHRSNSLESLKSQQPTAPKKIREHKTGILRKETSIKRGFTTNEINYKPNLPQTDVKRKRTVRFNVESKCDLATNFVKIHVKTIKGRKNPLKSILKFFMRHHRESRGPDVSFYEME